MEDILTADEVRKARERIRPHIRHTPLLRIDRLDQRLGCQVHLKPEMFQVTGSFKARGALSKALLLRPEERDRGLIASSSGNHAQALAYAGRLIGAKTVLVVPHNAPKIKVERTRALGAEVILFEGEQAARWAYVDELIERRHYTMVHASEDPAVMAGQGTIALEVLEDAPDIDTIVVPLGGGGLLSGIAAAVKGIAPHIRVVGVEPALAPKYYVSRKQGKPTKVPAGPSIADGVKEELTGANAYAFIERWVDELAVVEERYIQEGLRLLAEEAKLFAEGAAAVGIGAVLSGQLRVPPSAKVCFVLSGGNWDVEKFLSAFSRT
jgi:threonine dehydratase